VRTINRMRSGNITDTASLALKPLLLSVNRRYAPDQNHRLALSDARKAVNSPATASGRSSGKKAVQDWL
jgi:hypothetical protein